MLNKGIVGLAALVMPYVSAFGQTQTEAERALAQFPDTLPGAAKVEKYPVKGAKQVLVHLKNIHDGAYGQGRLPTNHVVYPYMLQGQTEMYQICQNLITGLNLDAVYSEGQVMDDFARDSIASVRKLVVNIEKRDLEEYAANRYKTDVIARVVLTKDVHTRGSESSEALNKGHEVVLEENVTLSRYVEYAVDKREDAVLERLSEQSEPLKILVYGGAHCFGGKNTCGATYRQEMGRSNDPFDRATYKLNKDNIAAWNAANPEKKFSLIEVTSQGIVAYDNFVGYQEPPLNELLTSQQKSPETQAKPQKRASSMKR